MNTCRFTQLRPCIENFGDAQTIDQSSLARLTLASEGPITVTYAPFDHIPTAARLAVVGITPGRVQAETALMAAALAMRAGNSIEESLRLAKLTASFSGTQTRNNLVAMLDAIGLSSTFGVTSCAELFDPAREQIHFTSALRYPVFVNGKNFNGSPTKTPLLRRMIETYLAEEVAALSAALWLPLGPKPAIALQHLVKMGVLPARNVLNGVPHPSGLNGERVAAFPGRFDSKNASIKTNVAKLTMAKRDLCRLVAGLLA